VFRLLLQVCHLVTYTNFLLNHIASSVRSKTLDQHRAGPINDTVIPHFFLVFGILGLHITHKITIFSFVTCTTFYSAAHLSENNISGSECLQLHIGRMATKWRLRRPNGVKITGEWRNYIIWNFVIFTRYQILLEWSNKTEWNGQSM
jgi:hypothetical protein